MLVVKTGIEVLRQKSKRPRAALPVWVPPADTCLARPRQRYVLIFGKAGWCKLLPGSVQSLWGANGSAHSLIDVITSDPTMPNVCPRGAIQTGAAAEVAALSKERAWTAQAEAQGETFYPLAIEAGGTLNARFHEFLQLLAVASSPSPAERAAFMAFALQRVRAVSLKGTCAIILARPVSRTAPGGVHRRWALPLIQPKPRPCAAASLPPPHVLSHGLRGLVLSQTPRRLGPRSRCLLLCPPPTPSAPDAWPQPQRRSSSFSHPTCKYFRTPTPAPLSLRAPVVVCLLCRSSQPVSQIFSREVTSSLVRIASQSVTPCSASVR